MTSILRIDFYSDLVKKHSSFAENEITCERGVIDRDLNRTYPMHEDYAVEHGVGQESLKRVLMAFADYDKDVCDEENTHF